MNFKKIALALAIASSFGAQAADLDLTPYQAPAYAATAEGQAGVYADFLAATPDGNVAYIFQSTIADADAGSLALVSQSGGNNYAAVIQSGMGALSFVKQDGTGSEGGKNKAFIVQKETGETKREYNDVTADSDVDGLAAIEMAARTLSLGGNVALVSQTSSGNGNNSAEIYQFNSKNFAAIVQTGGDNPNYAYINQGGSADLAYVTQTGTSTNNAYVIQGALGTLGSIAIVQQK